MIKLAVFDNDPANRAAIKNAIVKYTMQSLTDFDVFWFFENLDESRIKKYSSAIHIALISLNIRESAKIGKTIYQNNEDCRIVFYSSDPNELEPLLRVRPRGYYKTSDGENSLFGKIDDIVSEIKLSSNYFCHENKREIILIPTRQILYFQSDLKYVNICLKNGKEERVYAKLSEVESGLDSDFLRIHKSYLVNTRFVRSVNKSDKIVTLANETELPISEANYKDTLSFFKERESQNEQRKTDRN